MFVLGKYYKNKFSNYMNSKIISIGAFKNNFFKKKQETNNNNSILLFLQIEHSPKKDHTQVQSQN